MIRDTVRFCCMLLLAGSTLSGCASRPSSTAASPPRSEAGAPREENPASRQIVALVNGEPLTWQTLRRPLAERAGAEVLREAVLDHLLRQRCRSLGVTIEAEDLRAEEERLLEQISDDARSAAEMLEEIRRRRGLGDARYQQLLWRNAALRTLVAPDVTTVSEAALRSAYERAYGDLYELRLITVATLREATAARRRLEAGERFAEVAAAVSTDISRHRGGLLEPLSLADATYPQIIRDTARTLAPGDVSVPLALETGYALVRLEQILPGEKPPLEGVRAQLEAQVRLQQQRLLMDELARALLEEAQVTVFERGIDWQGANGG